MSDLHFGIFYLYPICNQACVHSCVDCLVYKGQGQCMAVVFYIVRLSNETKRLILMHAGEKGDLHALWVQGLADRLT